MTLTQSNQKRVDWLIRCSAPSTHLCVSRLAQMQFSESNNFLLFDQPRSIFRSSTLRSRSRSINASQTDNSASVKAYGRLDCIVANISLLAVREELFQNSRLLLFLLGEVFSRRLGGSKLLGRLLTTLDGLCDELGHFGYLISLLLGRILVFGHNRAKNGRGERILGFHRILDPRLDLGQEKCFCILKRRRFRGSEAWPCWCVCACTF